MALLSIGGVNLDNRAIIDSLSVNIGRQSINEQPLPGTFNCTFYLGKNETIDPIEIGDQVLYAVKSPASTGGQVQVFSGLVTDIQISLQWGSGTGLYMYSITAVDPLALLNQFIIGGSGYAKAYEGNRIKDILNEVYTKYGQSIDVSDIESPGNYEIAVYNNGLIDAYTLCTEAANSAMGTFYWNQKDFRLRYCTYTTRKNRPVTTLDAGDLVAADFALTASANNICNATQLAYAAGNGTLYKDTDSITKYGAKAGLRTTTLHNLSDANSIAQILLATRKDPNYNLNSITVNTAIVSDSLKAQLANIEVGTRIQVTNLPTNELEFFDGFVEAYNWTAARGQDILQMTVSSIEQQYSYTLWNQLNGTDTWQTYATATTKWSDIN